MLVMVSFNALRERIQKEIEDVNEGDTFLEKVSIILILVNIKFII